MLPQGGGMDAFGPGAPPALGTGLATGAQDGMAQDPTDPSATAQMQQMAPMGGPSIADAIQQAISQSMQELQATHDQQMADALMQQLDEAQQTIAQLMQMVGAEAQTLDGSGNIPSGQPVGGPPLGAPSGQDLNALLPQG